METIWLDTKNGFYADPRYKGSNHPEELDQTDRDIITARMFEARSTRWSNTREILPLGLCKRHRSFFSPTEDQILLKLKVTVNTSFFSEIFGV